MSRTARVRMLLAGAAALWAVYFLAAAGLPDFGAAPGRYAARVNGWVVEQRRVTDAVTAVNFDYRGADTLGEEFILFASVAGALLLLRKQTREAESRSRAAAGRRALSPSEAVRAWTLALVGPTVLFGAYVVTHGQLSPGGGFQGCVVLASAPLLVFLAGDLETFRRVASHRLVELAEGAGAFGFVALGLAGLALGGAFLENRVPLGTTGDVWSGGAIALISLATGLEVAAGFVLLMYAFLEEALERAA